MSSQSLLIEKEHFSLKAVIRRRPLLAYFTLVFVFTWLVILPVLLGRNGIGLLSYTLPDLVAFALFMLAAFTGPTLWAFVVTGILEGRVGIKHLLSRYVQWRVNIRWYVLIILGYPLVYVITASFSLGANAFSSFVQHWPLLLTVYAPHLFLINMIDALGEEPGFRGFALTRMQDKLGPFAAALIVGVLHAFWHLPIYFIPAAIGGPFSFATFASNSLGIIAITFIWAWVFNNAQGSILIAMLLHSASNAATAFAVVLYPSLGQLPVSRFIFYSIFILLSLVIIVATKGRLSYTARLGLLPARQEK